MLKPVFRAFSVFILMLAAFYSSAQDAYLPYSAGIKDRSSGGSEFIRNVEITIGYLPKTSHEGLKGTLAVNNLILNRIGFYTSFESTFEKGDFTNIIGGQVSVFKFIYIWGGMDAFTKNGLFQSGFEGSRKEAGIGITPYKFLVFRLGYSNSVGPSIAAGIRIPF